VIQGIGLESAFVCDDMSSILSNPFLLVFILFAIRTHQRVTAMRLMNSVSDDTAAEECYLHMLILLKNYSITIRKAQRLSKQREIDVTWAHIMLSL